jgi:spermidine synthase
MGGFVPPLLVYGRAARMPLALLAAVLSGAAGLIYQVAWVRRLTTTTSATATASAIVLAIFMAGLGLGSWLAGRRALKSPRPMLGYAAVEGGALVLAALSIPVIDRSETIRTLLTSHLGLAGAAVWFQLFAVAVFLMLPCTLLGASLPFLIEHCSRLSASKDRANRAYIGLVYGLNTLGAATGCLFSGFVTIEHFGLTGTTLVGAAVASGAVALAVIAALRVPPSVPEDDAEAAAPLDEPRLVFVAALGGVIGHGAEVARTRHVALVVLNTVYAFTQVLFAVLLGIVVGAWVAGAIIRNSNGRVMLARRTILLLLVAEMMFGLVPVLVTMSSESRELTQAIARGGSFAATSALTLLLAPPAAAIAATLPLLVAAAKDRSGSRSFGSLYAANTLGSVLGSLMIGFWVLPSLGLSGSSLLLVSMIAIAAMALLPRLSERAPTLRLIGIVSATALLCLVATPVPRIIYENRIEAGHRILDLEEGVASDVIVSEDPSTGLRRLWINSAWVATAGGGTGHGHRMFGHVPALLHREPRRALGIALGTGQTFAALLHHGVERLDCVDLNAGVIELSRRWFSAANGGLLEDRRVTVHIDDGRAFMRATSERFDLIVLEPLQAWTAWTSGLYSREFYEEARRVLAPDGVMLQWIPFYGQGSDETRSMVASATAVFPFASLWVSGFEGMIVLHREPRKIDPLEIEARIRDRGLEAVFAKNAIWNGADLLSRLLLGPKGVAAWVAGAEVVRDDRPFLEFAAARQLDDPNTEAIIESLAPFVPKDDLDDYLVTTSSAARATIDEAKEVRRAIFAASRVRYESWSERAQVLEQGLARAPGSRWLREYYRSYLEAWMRSLRAKNAEQDEIDRLESRARSNGLDHVMP